MLTTFADDKTSAVTESRASVTSVSAPRRTDLDGLRGVAIALVVAFHVWFRKVSGGVDVFLVLSGFFFTGMLLRGAERTGYVRLWRTITRTLWRLVPALVVMAAGVGALLAWQRPYTQWADLSEQMTASLLYYQNWHLARASLTYLAADPSVSPLQHMWSMAVQGQFYLAMAVIAAVVVWVCRKLGRPAAAPRVLGGVIVLAGVVSFCYAMVRAPAYQEWVYYDTGARAWELLAGALLALVVPLVRSSGRWSRGLRSVMALAGVTMIVGCGNWFDGARDFPGPKALFPVSATVLLIIAGMADETGWRPMVARWLSARPVVFSGDIAYALYLWHWPLLIFFLVQTGQHEISATEGWLVVSVAVLLAWATTRLVADPLRRRSDGSPAVNPRLRRSAAISAAVAATLVVAGTGYWQIVMATTSTHPLGALDATEYPGAESLLAGAIAPIAEVRPSVLEAPADLPPTTIDGCVSGWFDKSVVTCNYGDPAGTRTIAVVGNSHAEHWLPALDVIARQHGIKIVVYLKMGCPLNIRDDATYRGLAIPDCRDWSRQVVDRLGQEKPNWVFTTGTAPSEPLGGDYTPPEFLDVWGALQDRGLSVLAIRDTPWLRNAAGRYRAVDCLAAGGNAQSCGMRRADALSAQNPALEAASRFRNVHPIDLTDAVCEPEWCKVVEGNVLVYHDEHHLTASYVRTLTPELSRQLGKATGWW